MISVYLIDSTYGFRSMFFMISVYLIDSTYGFKTAIFGNVYLIDWVMDSSENGSPYGFEAIRSTL